MNDKESISIEDVLTDEDRARIDAERKQNRKDDDGDDGWPEPQNEDWPKGKEDA